MKASALSFRLAVLFIITGIAMGIGMAASQDHSLMPVHAHVNLLGWVSMFLFGLYYERRPALDAKRIALAQVGIWGVGTVTLNASVAALHLGHAGAEPAAALSSLIVLAGALLFAYFVLRPDRLVSPEQSLRMTPAE